MLLGFIAAVLGVYILDDTLIIKTLIYTAYLMAVSLAFPLPRSAAISFVTIFLFLFFEYHPHFMGQDPIGFSFPIPPFFEILPMTAIFFLVSIGMIMMRFFMNRYILDQQTIEHLDSVGKKMVLFNHRLQEMVKQRGEDAMVEERLRLTRELHDSCGYAFTNIIMVTDAAVSCGQMETANTQEIFQRIRKLASTGLNETRETLHFIRKIQEPYAKSIDSVYQLKKIFEEVTGIKVDIEWGNMRNEYGPTVNKVITRIIQEAFTNSIRHGKATHIFIQFWELNQKLSMIVTDNGIGASVIVKGIGLAGMEERLDEVGGELTVGLPPEGGFKLSISIPIISITAPIRKTG
ncbi:sensor histidine kinase [Treponema primitia]|uniref:sensor histidine kinase n=1 Tax=Treponema primitia TaxID=88058 RepID=UPI0018E0EC58|nr:histidine kinase [Treponema primitia]